MDLSSSENYYLVVSTVARFFDQVRAINGVCNGCDKYLYVYDDVKVATHKTGLNLFCSSCNALVFEMELVPPIKSSKITKDEVDDVSAFLQDPNFDKVFNHFLRKCNE